MITLVRGGPRLRQHRPVCNGLSGLVERFSYALLLVSLMPGVAACSEPPETPAPVSGHDAAEALSEITAIAAQRTPEAMARLCDLSLDDCHGISGIILTAPDGPATAPAADSPPAVLCSRDVGEGAWMVVVDGTDGLGRSYVSQVVFGRDDRGRTVPLREPAFWFGIAYAGTKVTGSTSWSTAYTAGGPTASDHTQTVLDRARRACSDG